MAQKRGHDNGPVRYFHYAIGWCETLTPEQETVRISLEVPKRIHDVIAKFADLEGRTPEQYCEQLLSGDFEAIMDDLGTALDRTAVIEHNQIQPFVHIH